MRTQRLGSFLLAVLFASTLLPVTGFAADAPAVLQVISVKVTGDRQLYLAKIKTLQGISKRLGLAPARVWRATLAGENTDVIYIATEYPNLAAMAAAQGQLTDDAEASKLLRDIDASGMRTVIDRSLMVDDTPK
jgi:hypothetical protein